MAKTNRSAQPREPSEAVFHQIPDARGRVRLDRPQTGPEAAAQDEHNRERYLHERAKRFEGRKGGEASPS